MKKVNKWAQFLCQSKDLASSLRHFGDNDQTYADVVFD